MAQTHSTPSVKRVTKSYPFNLNVHIHLLFLTGSGLTLIKYTTNLITPQFKNLEWLPTTYQKRYTQIPPSFWQQGPLFVPNLPLWSYFPLPASHPGRSLPPLPLKAFVNLWRCVRALTPLNLCRLGSPAVEASNCEGSMLECNICITVLLLPCTSSREGLKPWTHLVSSRVFASLRRLKLVNAVADSHVAYGCLLLSQPERHIISCPSFLNNLIKVCFPSNHKHSTWYMQLTHT